VFDISDYQYRLPPERIAQEPAGSRDRSRLMALDRGTGRVRHLRFSDIHSLLQPADLLVINNTAVVPARLIGRKPTGGRVEVLLEGYAAARRDHRPGRPFVCGCLVKASKPLHPDSRLDFGPLLSARVLEGGGGRYTLAFECRDDFESVLTRIGKVPLPPYIRRDSDPAATGSDGRAYQTVYAAHPGALAAHTAGLHFSRRLLKKIREKGVDVAEITLHVGYGTFRPVRVTDIREHRMHAEYFDLPRPAADKINRARQAGRRIVAVGTTCVRTLEFAADARGMVSAGSGWCDLFIYPGYAFGVVDAMITNFHLPGSTLLMLVAAFAGRERVLAAYREAIGRQYRFYSYGDAMYIA
jgi:S-adenosylmethionine:tRNA ribosyltransferase-isomerase